LGVFPDPLALALISGAFAESWLLIRYVACADVRDVPVSTSIVAPSSPSA
jgi:hypothetical protein